VKALKKGHACRNALIAKGTQAAKDVQVKGAEGNTQRSCFPRRLGLEGSVIRHALADLAGGYGGTSRFCPELAIAANPAKKGPVQASLPLKTFS